MEPGIAYLEIALRLRKLARGWLRATPARASLPLASMPRRPPVGAGELRKRVRALRDRLDQNALEGDRRVWLSAQLAALDTALAVLDDQRFSYQQLGRALPWG